LKTNTSIFTEQIDGELNRDLCSLQRRDSIDKNKVITCGTKEGWSPAAALCWVILGRCVTLKNPKLNILKRQSDATTLTDQGNLFLFCVVKLQVVSSVVW